MNNFVSRFYFLSKLTTSLILLVLLIFISYLFTRAYLAENVLENEKNDKISNQFSNINSLINDNSENIKIIKNIVVENKKNVTDISSIVENISNNNTNQDLLDQINILSSKNNELQETLNSIYQKFEKDISSNYNEEDQKNYYKENLVKLILLKLNNGEDFKEEVSLLNKTNLSIELESYVEKLNILTNYNFPGLLKLNKEFDLLASNYLNNYFFNNNNNISFYITDFISIKPNLNSNIKDQTVNSLSLAKKNLLKNNLQESINEISQIKNSKDFFELWINQAQYYVEVKNTLSNLLD